MKTNQTNFWAVVALVLAVGCAGTPSSESTSNLQQAELPVLMVDEYAYYLDQRLAQTPFLRGVLVLASDTSSLLLALRSRDLGTGKESYKEVRLTLRPDGRVQTDILMRRGERQAAFELDVADALAFVRLLREAVFNEEVMVRIESSHEVYRTVTADLSPMFPVYQVLSASFGDEAQPSYTLYHGGVVMERDYGVFSEFAPVTASAPAGNFSIRRTNAAESVIRWIVADLDTNWTRQSDGSYWLQKFSVRDAYLDAQYLPDMVSRFRERFPEASDAVIDALFLRTLLPNYRPFFDSFRANLNGNIIQVELTSVDQDGLETMHRLLFARSVEGGYLVVSMGFFSHVYRQNMGYFDKVWRSVRAAPPPSN